MIERHGYGCATVDLAVLDAEIACADNAKDREAAIAAAAKAIRGEPYRDERTGIAIDGGWWGLLPRLEALLPEDNFGMARLRLARDHYNDERDDYLRSTLARDVEELPIPVTIPSQAILALTFGKRKTAPSPTPPSPRVERRPCARWL